MWLNAKRLYLDPPSDHSIGVSRRAAFNGPLALVGPRKKPFSTSVTRTTKKIFLVSDIKRHQSTHPDEPAFCTCPGTPKSIEKHENPYENRPFSWVWWCKTRGIGGASPPRTPPYAPHGQIPKVAISHRHTHLTWALAQRTARACCCPTSTGRDGRSKQLLLLD